MRNNHRKSTWEKNRLNKIIEQLAQKEYELFVVNTTAVAVQGRDGNYYTEYIPVTPFLLQNMLSQKGSLGCYQAEIQNEPDTLDLF